MIKVIVLMFMVFTASCGAHKSTIKEKKSSECSLDIEKCFDKAMKMKELESPDFEEIANLFAISCDAQLSTACVQLGLLYLNHELKGGTVKRATGLAQMGCEMGDIYGCSLAGEIALQKQGTDGINAAIPWLERGCRGGNGMSCSNLAAIQNMGYQTADDLGDVMALMRVAIDLWKSDCEHGIKESCVSVGEIYAYGKGVPHDFNAAMHFFKRGCKLNSGEGCMLEGMLHEHGQGTGKKPDLAKQLYQKACDFEVGQGCAILGILAHNDGRTKESLSLFRKACDLKDGSGCDQVAVAYGTGANVPNDQAKAFSYYELACQYKYPGGCNAMGRMYQIGIGVAQNYAKAMALYLDVCDGIKWCTDSNCNADTAESCNNAGVMYSQGLGVQPDVQKAEKYFKKGCRMGNSPACKNFQKSASFTPGPKKENALPPASDFLLSGKAKEQIVATKPGKHPLSKPRTLPDDKTILANCESKRGDACFISGSAYEKGRLGVKQDYKKALNYYQRACDYNSAAGCFNAGTLYSDKTDAPLDYEKVFNLLQKACKLGHVGACGEIAYMFENGLGCKIDKEIALKLYRQACEMNNMLACNNMAHMIDIDGTLKYYSKACNGGYNMSCVRLAHLERFNCKNYDTACQQNADIDAKYNAYIDAKYQDKKQIQQILISTKTACEKKNLANSCVAYGYFLESGFSEDESPDDAPKYYKKACNRLKSNWGCTSLAAFMINSGKKNIPQATRLLKKACDNNFVKACHLLGIVLFNNAANDTEENKSLKYLAKACRAGIFDSCVDIMFSCELGFKPACQLTIKHP